MNKESFDEYVKKYGEKIINGKEISEFIKFELKRTVDEKNLIKNLSAIMVGDDYGSKTYVKLKNNFANDIGVGFNSYFIEEDESEESLISTIDFLSKDEETDGIIIQLPLPKKFNTDKILSYVNKTKDVDGFLDGSKFNPVLGEVILRLLLEIQESFENKTLSIISNSDIFGNKLEGLFLSKFNNLKIYKNIYSENNLEKIKEDCKKSDFIISIVGKKHFITHDFIKKDAIIFDIGITREDKELYGDVYLDDVVNDVKYITPPINGIGPMTVAMLFNNLVNR